MEGGKQDRGPLELKECADSEIIERANSGCWVTGRWGEGLLNHDAVRRRQERVSLPGGLPVPR